MRVALNGLFLDSPATGTGQYLRELVAALRVVSPQDEFIFVAPSADATAPAPIEISPPHLKRENFAKLEFEQSTFPHASKRIGATLAHVPHFGSPLFPTLPTVVTIHDLIPIVLPAYRGSARVRLYTSLASLASKRAQAILADSFASARDIETHLSIPREKIHVVHLAAHPRYQPIGIEDIQRVRSKYNLPERFVLYLGGFDVRKNVAQVVESFSRLEIRDRRTETGDWNLVVAGKLPESNSDFFPDPKRMAERFGIGERVQFIGFVAEEDKPDLYSAARVFLYPSLYEGFGLPPLEAMACGTPVIVSNTSSLPEVVGEAGVVLEPDDVKSWSEALLRLLTDEAWWSGRRERGLAQARQFSWERCARETLAVYRQVAGQNFS